MNIFIKVFQSGYVEMRRWNNKIWYTIAVSAVLVVGILNGCGSAAPNVNVESFDIQQAFAEDMSNADVLSSDSLNGEALPFGHEIQTETVNENKSNIKMEIETETAVIVEEGAVEKTQVLEVENTANKDPELTLIMVGDILLHTPVAESGVQQDGSYDFTALFANVRDEVEAADLALVNQEVILGGTALGITGYPSFNAPFELGDALVEAGFDVVLHATNHTLDKGKKGVTNCLSFWEDKYPQITVIGINESQEAQEDHIFVYEQEDIRVAVLNYTYGTNGIPMPSDMPYAVNLLEEKKVTADIAKAKTRSDFIIVCPHWGTEYQLVPSAEQERWTQIFLENGVDLVIGTHPHVIEPIEWVRDDNGNEMLVYYSLGNFVNWTSSSGKGIANRMVGGMAEITLAREPEGDVAVKSYGVEPIVCHLGEGANGVTTYFLSEYTEEMASQNAIIEQDAAFSRQYCLDLCEQVWGEWGQDIQE